MGRDTDFPLLRNGLKERLARGELSLCLRTALVTSSDIAFLADAAGLDALYVDLEHSTATVAEAARICTTAVALGLPALVRLPSVDDPAAVPLLDAGCQGLIAPHVESAGDARRFVDRCLLPPLGRRSPAGPALLLGHRDLPPAERGQRLNGATVLAVMLESPRAVAAAGAIAAVEGVDLLVVGTQDLSAELGVPGAVDAPAVVAAYEQVAAACAATGTSFGVAGVADPEVVARYVGLGARFVSVGSDADLLLAAARERVAVLRARARG